METQKTKYSRLRPRIQSWIDAIEPGTPEAIEPKSTHKRPSKQKDNNPRPAKRTPRRALITTAGNIMAPPVGQQSRAPASNARRSPRHQDKTPQKLTTRANQANDEVQEEDAPRLSRTSHSDKHSSRGMSPPAYSLRPAAVACGDPYKHGQPSPFQNSKLSEDQPESFEEESVDRSTSKSVSTKRSGSPTKMADLFMAERSTELAILNGSSAEKTGGFLVNYPALRLIGQGVHVIPISLQKYVEKYVHEADKPIESCYTTFTDPKYDNQLWERVVAIYKEACRCVTEGSNEGEWNDHVHGPLLTLVSEHPKYRGAISKYNVTSSRISPEDLYMKNVNGDTMGGKTVDYVIGLKPYPELKKRIKQTLALHPQLSRSLNQTPYSAIRTFIVFLSIETNPRDTGGQQAEVQLATWGYSGFVKLHQLLAKNGNRDEQLPAMPMLSVHGHNWLLSALHEDGDDNKLLSTLPLGTTQTIQGIFQIIKALDLIVHWGNTEYRNWYLSKVLRTD